MTRNACRRACGFTVLELIVALAIAIVLIAAVSSVTRALTDTARRQRELSATVLRREKCAELLRRDLRGWMVRDSVVVPAGSLNSVPSHKPGEDPPVLQFDTLADGLSGGFSTNGNVSRAVPNVRYFIRKNANGYDFVRIESGTDNQSLELLMFQSTEVPRVEFYVGKEWVKTWDFSKRPTGVRVTLGAMVFAVYL